MDCHCFHFINRVSSSAYVTLSPVCLNSSKDEELTVSHSHLGQGFFLEHSTYIKGKFASLLFFFFVIRPQNNTSKSIFEYLPHVRPCSALGTVKGITYSSTDLVEFIVQFDTLQFFSILIVVKSRSDSQDNDGILLQ